ncbi:unnamed protein product [Pelagomonas calceolata]|uniref:Serine hydrolase domain-containing protein n=1 Tax=Pelagomonas calceolata TaxID=35677 RepID=A0A7S4A891_9STRA|nr:unnamed protein product [Pelagomonas calceolata]|mmetsp:Transcript_16792/g.47919  ORF Transcript_16792/g.47919 Transcript_16792/m.47919 type:complete len:384 (-) Transcript_16792:19-1170(-)
MACNVACGTAGKTCNAACVTPPTRSDDDVRCAAYASELGVNEQKRLRVLCLHSFRTNAKILETQLMLRGWLKRLRDSVEFVYLDAPYACSTDEALRQDAAVREYFPTETYGPYREWWNASANGEYARLEATLKHVDDFIVNNGPFDGLLGFSQGAALACSLANLAATGDFPHRFGFVVALSPPPPRDPRLKLLDGASVPTKALFCVHERDLVVPAAATERLCQKFTNATLVRCPGSDHAPPKFSGDSLPLVAAFFAEVLQAPPLPPPPPLSRQSSGQSPKSPKRSLNIAGASHYVKGKNGGLVREAASLDSAEVALLPTLQPVRVVEHRALPTRPDGRPGVERCRIVEPVRGWVSRRCLKSVADLTSEEPSVVVSGGPGPPAL